MLDIIFAETGDQLKKKGHVFVVKLASFVNESTMTVNCTFCLCEFTSVNCTFCLFLLMDNFCVTLPSHPWCGTANQKLI